MVQHILYGWMGAIPTAIWCR